ncbi:hypothetical protein AAFC00_004424 [Neodothiora populina]|uniref:Aminotransferase class V domain-containing protein n=1 Tax=Neodothiora populina TaxID=2781224 RepID=A0ABR3PPU2_9PEZI
MTTDILAEIRGLGPVQCGAEAAKHFAFADGYRNLNHGSYGTYPVEVRSVLRRYQEKVEAAPDTFVRYEYRTHLLDRSRKAIADYMRAPVDTCVLVPNTSTGIDTILRNLTFGPADVIVCFSTIYGAFRNTVQYLTETTTVSVKEVKCTYPTSDDYICDAFEAALKVIAAEGKVAKVALFDTIVSVPGVCMPFEQLTKICRTHKVLSCIDGAHGVGHIPLRLQELDPDFFVSNCHKWLYVPRSCAVLYVPIRNQHLLRATLPTGFGFCRKLESHQNSAFNNFVENFASLGTLDDTPYLCIPAALEWREAIVWDEKSGEEAIRGYINSLAREGGQAVADILGTTVLECDPAALGVCCMTNVRLPLDLVRLIAEDTKRSDDICHWIMRAMSMRHQIAVYAYEHAGVLWVRLSAQIYLGLQDFEIAGEVLKELCVEVAYCKWVK